MEEYKDMEFRDLILELVKLFRPQVYIEVGVKHGYTFNSVSPWIPGKAIAVDIADRSKYIKQHGHVECYWMKSLDFAAQWRGEADLIFIDGDHSAAAVRRDVNAYFDKLKYGTGLMLLHDTHPVNERLIAPDRCGGAWEVAQELRDMHNVLEIVTLPGPWAGLSIIRRIDRHDHLAWRK